jgi:hypothetical protein
MKKLSRTIRNKKTCIVKFDEQHAIIKTANSDSIIGKKESNRAAYAITHGVVGLSAPKAVELKKRASE